MTESPIVIIGAGGHGKIVLAVARALGLAVSGLVDADRTKIGTRVLDTEVFGDDDALLARPAAGVCLANGIGSVRQPVLRRDVYQRFVSRGFRFRTLVHPSAIIAEDVMLKDGVQVMAGCVIQPGTRIGVDAIVNTGATIDHDCAIGDHVHVAPGATLSGDVTVGAGSHIGAGVTIVQGVHVGAGCLVRAGAVVVADIPDGATVSGVPARAA